jgi:hypothetical protein
MLDFTSEIKRPARPVTLYIAIAVAVVAVIALVLVVRYQKNNPLKEASGPVVIPGMLRPGSPDFEAYKDKVRIEGVKAYINLNFAGNRSASIDGIISNEGSRKLEAVEMHLRLFDVYGKLSKERTSIPMRPGIGLNKGPMEPLEKRTFTVWIESVEQLWNPKRVEIEITGLKYR